MKYLKIFENKILDDILDKINDNGERDLTSWEREYLASFSDVHKRTQLEKEQEIRNKEAQGHKSFGEYDPREDNTEFYKQLGADFGVGDDMENWINNMSDEDYKENQIEIFWDKLTDEEINDFFDRFSVEGNFGTKTWDQLPKDIKNVFITYLIQMGYIER